MKHSVVQGSQNEPGVLLFLNDVAEEAEEDFNRWHQQQHLSERLAIPGFQMARRYQAVGGQPKYMVVYNCDSIDVLASSSYRHCLDHPTTWTRKVVPNFRNVLRSACRETWSTGTGIGGSVIIVQCQAIQGREQDARSYIRDSFGPNIMETDGMVRMSLWETESAITNSPSTEALLRGSADNYAQWVLFLENYDLLKTALALHTHILKCEGGSSGLLIGSWARYQLISAANASSPRTA